MGWNKKTKMWNASYTGLIFTFSCSYFSRIIVQTSIRPKSFFGQVWKRNAWVLFIHWAKIPFGRVFYFCSWKVEWIRWVLSWRFLSHFIKEIERERERKREKKMDRTLFVAGKWRREGPPPTREKLFGRWRRRRRLGPISQPITHVESRQNCTCAPIDQVAVLLWFLSAVLFTSSSNSLDKINFASTFLSFSTSSMFNDLAHLLQVFSPNDYCSETDLNAVTWVKMISSWIHRS